jgi:drug/metabolite transporter (DMT)-like permease
MARLMGKGPSLSLPSFDTERLALAAFIAEAVLAGGNAVSIRFSNRELAPLWGASLRFLFAASLLLAIMAVRRLELPRGRALVGTLLYGLFIGGAFAFAYYALIRIHAGLGQTLLGLVPLATLLLAVAQRQERLRAAAVAGTMVALAGIVVISGASLGGSIPLLSLLAVLGAMLCFSEGTVIVRMFPPVHPITMNAVGMATGAALLVVGTLIAGEPLVLPKRAATWLALTYLVLVGSILVFVLYVVVVRLWNASRAAYSFVITPVVTVLVSLWLDNEPITIRLVLGGLLVLAGVYVGALRPARASRSITGPSAVGEATSPEA